MRDDTPTMKQRIRGTTEEFDAAAIELRRRQIRAETVWRAALRARRPTGFKFRRQHAVGPFIVDFYCADAKLGVEVDGTAHENRAVYDAYRTEHLERDGYAIIRFRNDEVLKSLVVVPERISRTVQDRRSQEQRHSVRPLSQSWERG